MANIFDYVEKYGDLTFKQKRFNEVDNLVLSLLAYCDLRDTKVDEKCHTLAEIGHEYLQTHRLADVKKYGVGIASAFKLLELCVKLPRYKDMTILDYEYNANSDMQFGGIVFELMPDLIYVAFEGTDQLISAWKEDADLACFFPVPAQIEAVEFLHRNVKVFGPDVIVGGHSKGGNLALVASMFMSPLKKRKILRVYSNDGPGLRRREFESARYRSIKKKYVHIVPETSIVGMLLRHDTFKVVKASRSAPHSHEIVSWEVIDSKLRRGTLSARSASFEKSVLRWLDSHNDAQRQRTVDAVFGTLRRAGVLDTTQLKKPSNLIRAIGRFNKDVDEETKKLVLNLVTGCIDDVRKTKKK